MDEQDRLKRIKFYKSAIFSIEDQIAQEKDGLILDSGMRRPDIVNTATIRRLEKQLMECRRILAELEGQG